MKKRFLFGGFLVILITAVLNSCINPKDESSVDISNNFLYFDDIGANFVEAGFNEGDFPGFVSGADPDPTPITLTLTSGTPANCIATDASGNEIFKGVPELTIADELGFAPFDITVVMMDCSAGGTGTINVQVSFIIDGKNYFGTATLTHS